MDAGRDKPTERDYNGVVVEEVYIDFNLTNYHQLSNAHEEGRTSKQPPTKGIV